MNKYQKIIEKEFTVDFWDQNLKSGGHDQTSIICYNTRELIMLLSTPEIIIAGRTLVLRCMKKGLSQWARNHHPWIVDYFLQEYLNNKK